MYSASSFKEVNNNYAEEEERRNQELQDKDDDEDINQEGLPPATKSQRVNRSNNMLDNFGKQKSNIYSMIISSDIIDPYLRAAFDGDTQAVIQQQYKLQKSLDKESQAEELWNKSLLGFFLALQNNQIKTANTFYKKYKLLRIIVWKLMNVYEQNVNPKKRGLQGVTQLNHNQYSHKAQMREELINQSQSSFDERSTKKKGSSSDEKSVKAKDIDKQITANINPVLNFDSNEDEKPGSNEDDNSVSLDDDSTKNLKQKQPKKRKKANQDSQNTDDKRNKTIDNDKANALGEPPKTLFKTIYQINKMKTILKSELAISFNTNLLKIGLNLGEDRVSALIVARYPTQLDEMIIKYAVQQRNMIFLHNVFFYNKNFLAPLKFNESESEDEEDDVLDVKLKIFFVEDLMRLVHQQFDFHDAEVLLSTIMSWKFQGRGNVLRLLCEIGHERVAARYMENYYQFSDWDFFFFCVVQEKQYFLKNALRNQYFDSDYMHNEELTKWVMTRLQTGRNLLYPLNLLLFTDFRKWTLSQLQQEILSQQNFSNFTKVAQQVITPNLDTNYMLITYNPIMTLALMIQFLKQIKLHFNYLDTECNEIIVRQEELGRIVLESMQFEDVEQIFLEKDFKDRSVLNIVTDNTIMKFIVKNKLKFLLDKIWEGKDSQMIDGKSQHFSRMQYLVSHEVKQVKGVEITMGEIMGSKFKPNIEEYNFIYQKKFREESILVLFTRDFFCAAILVCAFQYINYSYLSLFNQRVYKTALSEEAKYAKVVQNLETYQWYNKLGTVLSVSYFFSFGGRVVYNYFSRRRISFDLWVLFDLLCGFINILAFNVIGNASPEQLLNERKKWFLDYYMIVVLVFAWLRFFSYFLVITSISKVTITLFKMLWETISFLIILVCYLLLMTTIFATLFRNTDTEDAEVYHSLSTTFRALIDFFFANYPNREMANYTTSHSILYMLHVTFSNIFLLNYLVAILTTVYDIMIKNGDFYSIDYQYQFITKYIKSIEERNGYEVFILIPPPLNYFSTPLVFFCFWKSTMKRVSQHFQMAWYWFENMIVLLITILLGLSISPLVIAKGYLNIVKINTSNILKGLRFVAWTFLGWVFVIYLILVDLCMVINILCLDNSSLFNQGNEDNSKLERHKYYIYRDIIRSFEQLMQVAEHATVYFQQRQTLQRNLTENNQSIKQKIKRSENDQKADDIYIIRKEIVVAAYLQISNQNPYIRQYRQQYQQFSRRQTSGMLYSSIDLNNEEIRQQFKENPEISDPLKMLVGRMMISNNKDDLRELIDFIEKDRIDNDYSNITDDEAKLLNSFVNRYTIAQKNQEETTVNLQLVLKTFPSTFTPQHIQKMDMLHFQRIQKCLISFFNNDQDEMFNYYDNRMKRRLNSLKRNSNKNSHIILKILGLTQYVLDYIQWDEAVNKIRKEHSQRMSMASSVNGFGLDQFINDKIGNLMPAPHQNNVLTPKYQVGLNSPSPNGSGFFTGPQSQSKLNLDQRQMQIPEYIGGEMSEGFDFLLEEQRKNLKRMLSYKNKSLMQNQRKIDEQSQTHLLNYPQITLTTPQINNLVLPSADDILKQIRRKRKEKQRRDEDSGDEYSSVDDDQKSDTEVSQEFKKNTLKNITMTTRRASKMNVIAQQVDDSLHTDKSIEAER